MNRFYLIVPVVLLALFGGVFYQFKQTSTEEAKKKAAVVELAKAEERAKKEAAERQAREDAARRAAEREAEEKRKEEEKRAKWAADSKKIEDDTAEYQKRVAELTAEIKKADAELVALRAAADKQDKENFELAREVELARIAKRNAELEIQRAADVVATRAQATVAAN